MRHKKRLLCLCIVLLFVGTVLSGSLWKQPDVVMDVKANPLYRNLAVAKVISELNNASGVKNFIYENNHVAVLGKVNEIKGNDLYLISDKGDSTSALKCTVRDSEVKRTLGNLKNGELVKVYGQYLTTAGIKNFIVAKVEKITEINISDEDYSLISGKTVNRKKMVYRGFGSGRPAYYIPQSWTEVELNLIDNDLGTMDGYQYVLNDLSKSSVQESLFICYFDNDKLTRAADRTDSEAIEKAIVGNIMGSLNKDNLKSVGKRKSESGIQYSYYQEAYNKLNGEGFHTEFAFVPNGEDGMVVFLYVYKKATTNLDDILITMNLLKMP